MLESISLSWKPQSVSPSVQAAITGYETGWLINDRNIFLSVVEAGNSKIKVPADSVSGKDLLSGSHCGRGERALWNLL